MVRVRYWKWRVSLVGMSALLLIMGFACLPDPVRASAVSSMANFTRNFETEFAGAFARALASAQTEFHRNTQASSNARKPGTSVPANLKISTTSLMAAEFDLSHRFGGRSLLTEYRLGGHPESIREIAAAMFGDNGAEMDSFRSSLSSYSHIASNIRNQNLGSGGGGSSGAGGVNGGRSADRSIKAATGSSVGSDAGHLRTGRNHVSGTVSSRRTDKTDKGLSTVALAEGSTHSGALKGGANKISAHEGPGASGTSGPSEDGGRSGGTSASVSGGTSLMAGTSHKPASSKDSRRNTFQDSTGSGVPAVSGSPGQDSGPRFRPESRTDTATLASNGSDDMRLDHVNNPGASLGAQIPDLPSPTESGVDSRVIAEDFPGSDGGEALSDGLTTGLSDGDLPAANFIRTFENRSPLQDQASINVPAVVPEPPSLVLFGTVLIGMIAFAKIKGLWQSQM
jgi:hypothetical protein